MTVTAEDVLGSRTLYQYDADGNLASTTDALGNVTTNTYDIYGNVTSVTDPLGNTTSYQYNARDQLTCAVLPSGSTTTYFYDNAGNLTAQEDGLGHRIRYTYNANGSRQAVIYADGTREDYIYDAAGNRASKEETTPSGSRQETIYKYDASNRLQKEVYRDKIIEYTYDNNGNLLYQETNSTEAAAVFGAVAEVVSQKLFEKKEKIDWKAVAYEAVVGGVSAAVGGVIGKKLASKTTGSATKKIVKSAVAAGVSESSSGFATDVGKQIFVEDKKLDEVDYGQAAKTASIAGIAGIAGVILGAFKESISGYRLETKQRKVKRYSVRYQCFNAIENCPNHPNYPVVTGVREQMETYQEWVYVGKEYADDLADSTKKGITKAAKSTETVKKAAEKKAASTIQDGAAETVTKKESLLDRVKKWWENRKPIKYSPINPGMTLKDEIVQSFNVAVYTKRMLKKDTVMYRVSGGKAGKVGSYMSMTLQEGGLQSQLDLALNPIWENTTENVTKVLVPKGTIIYEGIAAPQNIYDSLGNVIGVLPGGGNQIFIPHVEEGWFQ